MFSLEKRETAKSRKISKDWFGFFLRRRRQPRKYEKMILQKIINHIRRRRLRMMIKKHERSEKLPKRKLAEQYFIIRQFKTIEFNSN